ncbi:hypothetical protein [Paraburkholderia caffeinilytica]|nr:hypothetical protein [Paraburkholderia caffeinilytica]
MIDQRDFADAAREFGTVKHRVDPSITSGEVTLAGAALEAGAGKDP